MNSKDILNDCDAAILSQWKSAEACPHYEAIHDTVKQLREFRQSIKTAKTEKQLISKQFKDAKGNTEKTAELKASMQENSKRLAGIDKQVKALEIQLLGYFSSVQEIENNAPPWPPARYAHHKQAHSHPASEQKSTFTLRLASNKDQPAWDVFVKANPLSSAYHAFSWKHVLENAFQHHCFYILAEDEAKTIVGLLPLVALNSKIFGHFAVSMPFFNYGGLLVAPEHTQHTIIHRHLIEYAKNISVEQHWQHIELRTCQAGMNFPSQTKKVSMVLPLPKDEDTLDKNLGAKVRAQYKAAQKAEPTTHIGGIELLNDFYHVFASNMRDLGTPVYAKSFFAEILKSFPEQAVLVIIKVDQKPAGVAFLFGDQDILEIPWASTLKKYNQLNINMWMYRQILGFAIQKHYAYFDFGRSTQDAGTYKFKKQWGAMPIQHHWYYLLNGDDAMPEINPDNPKFKLVIALWKMLPVWVTKIVGPIIVKNIP